MMLSARPLLLTFPRGQEVMMSFKRTAGVALFTLLATAAAARGEEDLPSAAQPGKAAAHAALEQGAALPATAPQLPLHASEQARRALADTAFGKKGDAMRRAHSQAEDHANDDARSAHVDAANRAAQGAAAAAARNANADSRAAAGQARATAAKAGSRRP